MKNDEKREQNPRMHPQERKQSKTLSARIPIPFMTLYLSIRFLIYRIRRIEREVFYAG
jgi:hypothetical protein